MHLQVVTYRIADINEADFIAANREFAEMMAAVPGLIAKIWLRGDGADSFGGVYLWQDREAYESFLAGELWAEALNDDSLLDLASHDYGVMDELTKTTQLGVALV
jgi:antibiotic biosynthesis monooxygenase (ABM) superfamily enzyme